MINLSGKVDPARIEILQAIDDTAAHLHLKFFIVGATARDLILNTHHHITSRRHTMDIDFAFQVADWDAYTGLVDTLAATGLFSKTEIPHRLQYRRDHFLIDILPFGPIMDSDGMIMWPQERRMTVLGFKEAYDCSEIVVVQEGPRLEFRVATPVGLAIMKLVAWADSDSRGDRDAQDLDLLLSSYADAGNIDRLYSDRADILEFTHFDLQRAGAILLGQDVAAVVQQETKKELTRILETETAGRSAHRLAIAMMRKYGAGSDFEVRLQALRDFTCGLTGLHTNSSQSGSDELV